ncbi:MAG: hypothetical protein FWG83_03925, partial [Oscillospiraceae bacterium]|nr:hypothetical protein [Oscillospiraceae bacterium]
FCFVLNGASPQPPSPAAAEPPWFAKEWGILPQTPSTAAAEPLPASSCFAYLIKLNIDMGIVDALIWRVAL